MKILIALHDLSQVGGTQTWALTMGRELIRQGHEVEYWALVDGLYAKHISTELAVPVHLYQQPRDAYELLLICQNVPMQALAPFGGFKIYTQHGPYHAAEQYPGGADRVVAVSRETQQALLARGHHSEVIWNGIDLERFRPGKKERDALILCKGDKGQQMAIDACCQLGWDYKSINYKVAPKCDIAPLIRSSKIVITYGRGALEAIASDSLVFCFDARGDERPRGDGWVDEECADFCMTQTGFNGRSSRIFYDSNPHLRRQLSTPRPDTSWQREWAEKNIDIKDKVRDYLALVSKGVEYAA